MAALGRNIIISVDGTPVAAVKSHEITTDANTIEVASPSQQDYEEHIPGRKSWSIMCSYLLTAVADITKVLQAGTVVTITSGPSSGTKLTGRAIVRQCKQTYTVGNISVGNFQFQGTGPLTTV